MVHPLQSKASALEELNALLAAVFDAGEGAFRAEISQAHGGGPPVSNDPITTSDIYQVPGPQPLQSKVASLIKINNHLTNITSTNGLINATLVP